MLDDKTMVADALAGVNGELVRYGEMIPQTENKELKQCLKQMRNECEMSQEKPGRKAIMSRPPRRPSRRSTMSAPS